MDGSDADETLRGSDDVRDTEVDVETTSDTEDCPVPMQEQADEMDDGDPWHWDT